ncbi:MAG: tRNA threonylcarbamoyladenosine biosynthesis protein TsaE [Bacteroides sp. SM23_62_1]|nr:MAG: tRNA threonylcarbamoyladenosine biosynthesis protein TsaE [Bacteroides sp. SM23_62_1]
MTRFIIESTAAIRKVAKEFLKQYGQKRIFAIYGELGAGKTTFIKALCYELGVNEIVSSPSFAIINEYYSDCCGRIYHFDFFRLEELAEAFDIGYEDYFYSGQYCFIEWADRIEAILPSGTIHVHMAADDTSARILEVNE